MRIGNVDIGIGHRCAIVSELSNAHNGSYDRMLLLMKTARDAGADILKVQAYTVDELVELRGNGPAPAPWNDRTMEDLYIHAQTPLSWMRGIFDHAEKLGISIFSSVFGAESLACLEDVGCPAYKLAALDFDQKWLRDLVLETGKPLLRSTSRSEMGWAPGMLWCPPGYPTHCPSLMTLRGGFLGLSYHGKDPLVPIAAVAMGAKVIEMHFMLSAEPSELESNVSLTESQFAAMVRSVRHTEDLMR